MNFKTLVMCLISEMAVNIKSFRRLIHLNSSSLRMRQTKTSYTSTTSVMDAETSRYGVHASSVQHAKMLIYVRHASIRDCKDLTLKKEE